MGRILIAGASSKIGRALHSRLGTERAVSTFHRTPIPGGIRFNCLTEDLEGILAANPGISHAVLLFANPNPDSCDRDPVASRELNVTRMLVQIEVLRKRGIMPVFASSELVFDGTRGNYAETDEARPVLLYGQQKLEVERALARSGQAHLVVRIAKAFGKRAGDDTLFTHWIDRIQGGHPVVCAVDQVFAPIREADVAESIVRLLENKRQGIDHVSCGQAYSRKQLLQLLLRTLPPELASSARVRECRMSELGLPAARPLNVSLLCEKLRADTGFSPMGIPEACREAVLSVLGKCREIVGGP